MKRISVIIIMLVMIEIINYDGVNSNNNNDDNNINNSNNNNILFGDQLWILLSYCRSHSCYCLGFSFSLVSKFIFREESETSCKIRKSKLYMLRLNWQVWISILRENLGLLLVHFCIKQPQSAYFYLILDNSFANICRVFIRDFCFFFLRSHHQHCQKLLLVWGLVVSPGSFPISHKCPGKKYLSCFWLFFNLQS